MPISSPFRCDDGCPHHHKQSKHKHTSPEVDEKIDDCGLSLLLPNPDVVVVSKRYAEEQPDKVNLCQEALRQSSQVKSDCGFVDDGRSHSSSRFRCHSTLLAGNRICIQRHARRSSAFPFCHLRRFCSSRGCSWLSIDGR